MHQKGKSGEQQTLQSKLKLTLNNLGWKIGNEQLKGITLTIDCSGSVAKLTLLHFDSLASGVHVMLCLNTITTHAKQIYITYQVVPRVF